MPTAVEAATVAKPAAEAETVAQAVVEVQAVATVEVDCRVEVHSCERESISKMAMWRKKTTKRLLSVYRGSLSNVLDNKEVEVLEGQRSIQVPEPERLVEEEQEDDGECIERLVDMADLADAIADGLIAGSQLFTPLPASAQGIVQILRLRPGQQVQTSHAQAVQIAGRIGLAIT